MKLFQADYFNTNPADIDAFFTAASTNLKVTFLKGHDTPKKHDRKEKARGKNIIFKKTWDFCQDITIVKKAHIHASRSVQLVWEMG